MAYSGRFKPRNPGKYRGDVNNIVYRSLWELKFMNFCDQNEAVLEYASEEIVIPYLSPVDGKWHRYFTDFWVKIKDKDDVIKKYLIEIKPEAQTKPPKPPKDGRSKRRFLRESKTYAVNQAKWKAAREFCNDNEMEFIIMTEKILKPYNRKDKK